MGRNEKIRNQMQARTTLIAITAKYASGLPGHRQVARPQLQAQLLENEGVFPFVHHQGEKLRGDNFANAQDAFGAAIGEALGPAASGRLPR